jgi:Fe-S-cluster-containing hydrogenase component 2
LAYTLAGADCIDVAADLAVIASAQAALKVAGELTGEAQRRGFSFHSLPLLMVSLNDGEDPHFRKAEFNPTQCPTDCPRPCETICPANAIAFSPDSDGFSGVIDQRCYGCGRCIPVCPSQLIFARSYVSTPEAAASLVLPTGVDALEIHTQIGRLADFRRLWQAISPWIDRLKLIAISCPDGEGLIEYLRSLYDLMKPLPCVLVWQTDGRPMSGDIGAGTTHAAIKLGQKVLSADLPGYVQLAGGTNSHTVIKLKELGLLNPSLGHRALDTEHEKEDPGMQGHGDAEQVLPALSASSHLAFSSFSSFMPNAPCPVSHRYIAGVAYGSYARVLLSPVLDLLEKTDWEEDYVNPALNPAPQPVRLEDRPELLWQAVAIAHSLVSHLKSTSQR